MLPKTVTLAGVTAISTGPRLRELRSRDRTPDHTPDHTLEWASAWNFDFTWALVIFSIQIGLKFIANAANHVGKFEGQASPLPYRRCGLRDQLGLGQTKLLNIPRVSLLPRNSLEIP